MDGQEALANELIEYVTRAIILGSEGQSVYTAQKIFNAVIAAVGKGLMPPPKKDELKPHGPKITM